MKAVTIGTVLVLVFAAGTFAQNSRIDASTGVQTGSNATVYSWGQAIYYGSDGNPAAAGMSGNVTLFEDPLSNS